MSITGVGNSSAANALAGLIGPTNTEQKPQRSGAAAEAEARVEASRSRSERILNEIREKGIYAWAQEQKLEKLKARFREQVLADQGLTEEDLGRMPPDKQKAVAASIEELVAQLVKDEMEKVLKNRAAADADGKTPTGPQIIDISV